jgi:hypothetical protein
LNNKTPIGYPYPYYGQTSNITETGQPDGQHHNTHPVYHLQHLISTTPLHTTRPEPYRTLQQLTHAELITTARKTIAQLARTQHPYPNHIPNRYYRHFQRSFDPDAAFQHLFRNTLHAVPTDHPYTVALDGTTVPRTGASIPGAHWTPNPTNAPFARGLRKAQRFVMAGWLDDDPNARCVPIYWLPTFSQNARYANPASRRSEIQGWIATLQHRYARGSTRQGAPSNGCCVWATDGAIPKRWASWSCRTRSAACARAKTRAGATCRRVRLQVGGVGGCIATQCGHRKTSGSSARGGNGCHLTVRGREVHLLVRVVKVRVVAWGGARGCFS